MEVLADTTGLRVASFRLGILIHDQIQLVIMLFQLATVLGAAVSQNAQYRQLLSCLKLEHSVIQ